jgi:pilus assembly protein Flp/PilA
MLMADGYFSFNRFGAYAMKSLLKRFLADESAVTSIEYALIASLVSIAVIASVKGLSTKVSGTFNKSAANMK